MKRYSLLFAVLLLLVVGCTPPTPELSPLSAPHSPLAVPVTPVSMSAEARSVGDALAPLVAEKTGIPSEALTLVSAESVSWRDASLGCPEPGKMYAQVIIEGWHVIFQGPEGEVIDVRTTADPQDFRICEQEAEMLEGAANRDLPAVVAAIALISQQEGLAADEIAVVEAASVQWANSCLGCADPGENCLMVITPGYRVILEHAGRTYQVHTSQDGSRVRLCKAPRGRLIDPPSGIVTQ